MGIIKTAKMQEMEANHGRSIEAIVRDALELNRGMSRHIVRTSLDLDVTETTLRDWCRILQIDLNSYREVADGTNQAD